VLDYGLTEEQQAIQELARTIADEQIRPVAAEYDLSGEFPWPIVKKMAEVDLFGILVPEEFGGFGGAMTMNMVLVTEELSRACGGIALSFAGTALGVLPIIIAGSEEAKERFLPAVATGERLCAFAITEPDAGSDAGGVKTTAIRDGDHYVLNGTKQWITNAGEAEINTVIALTDKAKGARGASAFIVEKGDPGVSFGKKEKKMGIRASVTREVVLEDVRLPKDRLLGREGLGFIVTMRTLDLARPGAGALAVGLAQSALDEAASFAKERHQFGQPIIALQAVQHLLADMATKLEAARALVYAVARYIDSGPKDFTKQAAMAKVFPTDMAMEVTIDAVQVMGGHGYMREYPVEKMMRDAKILQIFEGTNQIMRNIIGLALNKEYSKKK
jgi:butyryl-CoA dehydrogenase